MNPNIQYANNGVGGVRLFSTKMSGRSLCVISIILYLIIIYLPFYAVVPSIVRLPLTVVTYGLFFLALLISGNKKVTNACVCLMFLVIIFGAMLCASGRFGDDGLFSSIITMITFTMPVFYAIYLGDSLDQRTAKKLRSFLLIILVVTSITTILGLERFPLASRALAGGATEQAKYLYKSLNIGGYDFVYGIAFICPFFISANIKKIYKYLMLGLFVVCIVQASYMTAILLLILCLAMEIVVAKDFHGSEKRMTSRKFFKIIGIVVLCVVMLFVLSSKSILSELFGWIMNFNFIKNNSTLYQRVDEMLQLVLYNNSYGTSSVRFELYNQSIMAFKESPIVGTIFEGASKAGEHSEVIDLLANTGVVGLLFSIGIISLCANYLHRIVRPHVWKRIKLYSLVLLGFALINTVFWCPTMIFDLCMMPILNSACEDNGKVIQRTY